MIYHRIIKKKVVIFIYSVIAKVIVS